MLNMMYDIIHYYFHYHIKSNKVYHVIYQNSGPT